MASGGPYSLSEGLLFFFAAESYDRLQNPSMRRFLAITSLLVASASMLGQGIPLATLAGRVTADGGGALPGVVVTAESAELQDHRDARTFANGEYVLPFLPPGDYRIRFALRGMQTVERTIRLSAAGSGRLDVVLSPAKVEESVAVSAEAGAGTPLDTTQVMSNYKKALTDQLPIDRTLRSVALLAPGVTDNGPTGNIGSANTRPALVISGAQSFESLFLVDGAVVNENLRGQPQDLFIEDAIQETTVLSGSVSAEYGRFTGGVVNVATRSGGNEFHGSFRTSFSSDAWRALDPNDQVFEEESGVDPRIQRVDESYEATFGGPLWKDRIWFFAAGRRQAENDSQQIFSPEHTELGDQGSLLIPYVHATSESRIEGKLTGNLTASHNLVADFAWVDPTETNRQYLPAGDLTSLDSPHSPHDILTLNYNGVLSSRLFLEAQYSRRRFEIEGGGSPYSDFVHGTRVDVYGRDYFTLNSPAGYAGHPERYGNESWLAKTSYLLTTEGMGTHDLRAGYEWFQKTVKTDFDFSGSGFIVSSASILRDNQAYPVVYPVIDGIPNAGLEWRMIENESRGDRFLTQSAFFNDRWQWGRWSFNLGVRYDANDSRDSGGQRVSTGSAWSPRLAAQYDPSGNGRVILNAGYARYVAGLHEGIVQLFSPFGQPSVLDWDYTGPCINCDMSAPTGDLLTTQQALAIVQDWFKNVGMESAPSYVRIQGVNRLVSPDGLRSPAATEYSFGAGAALGSSGWVRADFLYRNYSDFYDNRIDLGTGQVESQYGPLDVEYLENSPILRRRYEAVQLRIDYRFTPAIFAGGSYTWSRLTGNVVGENENVSAAPEFVDTYPEYQRESWSYPTGYLPGDQRNRARLWVGGQFPTRFGAVGMAVLESYASGLPYEATAFVSFSDPSGVAYVANPGYHQPPGAGNYFFSGRGAYRTDDVSSTDIALTLTLRLFDSLDVFLQPQVLNVFNQHADVAEDATVLTADDGFQPFNPFTTKPVRGVNYELASTFGTPVLYQPPRMFRFSVGARF